MNALDILEAVRGHGGRIEIADGELVVRSSRLLPEQLQHELRAHKAELLIALGSPMDQTVSIILQDLRPHLPVSLRALPDGKLLALVNWSIIAAWTKALKEVTR